MADVEKVSEKRREQCRRAQAKYERTAKGKATEARYALTEKYRKQRKRDRLTRIFVGRHYLGRAATVEQAAAINAVTRRRLREFIEDQKRCR